MSNEKLAQYVKKVQMLKKRTDFPLKLGIEVDFIPGLEGKIERVAKLKHFDYVIGSVHFINNWGFDDPKYISEYQKWDIAELLKPILVWFNNVRNQGSSTSSDI